MGNLTTFNSIGGFSVTDSGTTVIDANANVYGNIISASGNVTGNVFIGNGASLTNVSPQEQMNWNTWVNGSNLANCLATGNVSTYGNVGVAAYSGTAGYGYELTNNTYGAAGSIYWVVPNINWSSNNSISFKASVTATSSTRQGGEAGDGPTIYVGGSTYATTSSVANAGLGVWVCWYAGTPKVVLFNGSTELRSQTLSDPFGSVNSTTVFQYGTLSSSTNWYDLELVIKRFGSKRFAEVKVNGSMVLQHDVTSWTPSGSYVSVAAQCGAAYSAQYCRAFSASW